MLSSIQRLETDEWAALARIAAKNQEHLICGGFRRKLQAQLQMILRRIMATTANTLEIAEMRTGTYAAASSKGGGGRGEAEKESEQGPRPIVPAYVSVFSLMADCRRHSSDDGPAEIIRTIEKDSDRFSHCRHLINSNSPSSSSSSFDGRVAFIDAWTVR
mmetsp:Transcript_6018/g.8282  ORF Transcript_6018/g.8282 Transcript_6018/m.8282 type:complete len:160 (-) Transcript_6018:113-592(-)